MSNEVRSYGWEAQPRDLSIVLSGKKNIRDPKPQTVASNKLPDAPLAKSVLEYAERELSTETFNHSMRVYYYGNDSLRAEHETYAEPLSGKAIQTQQFPEWRFTDETYLLACLLHDIGTTDKNISATKMSFEFYGGFLAHSLLSQELHAPIAQAESVVEAIIRHQDIGDSGKITTAGLLLQLATIFDNMGGHKELVHEDTIADVTRHYPRNKWSSCFAATIRKENELKPWAHTTALGEEDFPNGVLNNKVMEPYD
ncbi:MAG: hypothetical protein LQ338_008110 [Usnochroma carphineum]|nr:MAG: hypothetical protein LQ338_008110 [Usnochroma carphineum]